MIRNSPHEVRITQVLKESDRWLTNHEIAEVAKVAERTARLHTLELTKLGLVEVQKVFPSYRYRWAARRSETAYERQLNTATQVLGMDDQ